MAEVLRPRDEPGRPGGLRAPSEFSIGELVGEISREASLLVRKEVDLARAEMKADLRSEVKAAIGLGVAAVAALMVLAMLLVAAAMGLAYVLPAWGAALIVAGVMLALGVVIGLIGWKTLVRRPLGTTVQTLKDDIRWTKERFA